MWHIHLFPPEMGFPSVTWRIATFKTVLNLNQFLAFLSSSDEKSPEASTFAAYCAKVYRLEDKTARETFAVITLPPRRVLHRESRGYVALHGPPILIRYFQGPAKTLKTFQDLSHFMRVGQQDKFI
jgi:hypothetical protein